MENEDDVNYSELKHKLEASTMPSRGVEHQLQLQDDKSLMLNKEVGMFR